MTKEPTVEEMLEWFAGIKEDIGWDIEDVDENFYEAIRAMIQSRRTVMREQVEKWAIDFAKSDFAYTGGLEPNKESTVYKFWLKKIMDLLADLDFVIVEKEE